jgi:hypothetical protein
MAQLSASGCEDPLSGLATVPYLRTRLGELYREAAQRGTSPADTHRLLVVSLPRPPDPWHRMALAIVVGYDLRAAFPGGETLGLGAQTEQVNVASRRWPWSAPSRKAGPREGMARPSAAVARTCSAARTPCATYLRTRLAAAPRQVDELAP